jgi:hypothetical protein
MKSDREIWADIERRLLNFDPNAFTPPAVVRMPARSDEFKPSLPTVEDRDEYQYELTERAGLLLDSGLDTSEADAAALAEVGRFEFWLYVQQVNAWVGARVSTSTVRPWNGRPTFRPSAFCQRCESGGHDVVSCPFGLSDADAMKVARLRRECRGLREAAA